VRSLEAYSVPHPTGIEVKLDANENPFPLPSEVRHELARHLAEVELNRYPPSDGGELRELLAAECGVARDSIVFGNGSDEIIHLLCATFAEPRPRAAVASVLFPTPSFAVFRLAAIANGSEPIEVPLLSDFSVDRSAFERELEVRQPSLVFLARPNNPTGTLPTLSWVAELAARYPEVLFISDEAYGDYGAESALPLAARLHNLLIMRTLSKIGLAGLRIGYLCAAPEICREVDKVRGPYNIGSLNLCAAIWLLRNHRHGLRRRCQQVVAERERMAAALAAMSGVELFPSAANFLLLRIGKPGDRRATQVWQRLCQRGILVRCFDAPGPLEGCLRVTIGTTAENERFLEAMAQPDR
jgi:histidinol-phosphate aminotransferase